MGTKYSLALFLVLLVPSCHGLFKMVYPDDTSELVVTEGDPVTLLCKVIAEDPRVQFEWFRFGADNAHEVIAVGLVMTNNYLKDRAEGPVEISREYETSEDGADVTYTMTISAARAEDNARYGCGETEVITEGLATLHVQRTPEEIYLYSSKLPITGVDVERLEPMIQDQMVSLNENEEGYFMCVADGFIPKPKLQMTFNGVPMKKVEYEPVVEHIELSQSHPSYQYRVFKAVAVTNAILHMEPTANRLELKCTATVEQTGVKVEVGVRPVLKTAPNIECTNVTAPNGSTRKNVTCIIDADPEPEEVYWEWREPGDVRRLDMDQSYDMKYTSTKTIQDNGLWKVSLTFSRLFPQMFRRYELVVSNSIGNTSAIAHVIRDYEAEPPSGAPGFSSTIPILILSVALWRLIV